MPKGVKQVAESQVSDGGNGAIAFGQPYRMTIKIKGVAPLLFHAWNNEAVAEKAKRPKNDDAKKTDNLESYVYRTGEGLLGVGGDCFRASLVEAGRFMQDPRSPRKSMRDLCKAGLVSLTAVAPFTQKTKEWDFEDRRRVVIQRAGVTRVRPAMREGWECAFDVLITLPEYFSPEKVLELASRAGQLCGVCDYRPTYGRFVISGHEVHKI